LAGSSASPTNQKLDYLETLMDTFIPGRVAELRSSSRKELAATMALRMPVESDNWSLKISAGWPEDPDDDVAAGAWAGLVPLTTAYGEPLTAPDVPAHTPLPDSVRAMTGTLRNMAAHRA
jgi:hypothetical protein